MRWKFYFNFLLTWELLSIHFYFSDIERHKFQDSTECLEQIMTDMTFENFQIATLDYLVVFHGEVILMTSPYHSLIMRPLFESYII